MTLISRTTVLDLIEETRAHLIGASRPVYNLLLSDMDKTTTTVRLTYEPNTLTAGSVIAIDTESMYVFQVSKNDKTATVYRGYNGTTPANHTAGAMIEVNPRFEPNRIKNELRNEIRSWDSRLFRAVPVEATVSANYRAQQVEIDYEGDWYGVLEVFHAPDSNREYANNVWERITWWEENRNQDDAMFASGNTITIKEYVPTGKIRIELACPFNTTDFTSITELESDVGLATSMLDIPPLGAAARLLAYEETQRSDAFARGLSASDERVPPGHMVNIAASLERIRDRRIDEEVAKLQRKYPHMNG